ncbi:unnamed protein product [Mytilus edulis]|uniref:Uncharacterized protein n=1 Tax=Mytilus edulis TaxID=6550 RepID=A0A8S3USU9_MYTED|nr:unnamed protein product [Mytilus edulis]
MNNDFPFSNLDDEDFQITVTKTNHPVKMEMNSLKINIQKLRNEIVAQEKEIVNKNARISDLALSLEVKEEMHDEECEQLENFIKAQGEQYEELEKQRRFAESTLFSVQTSVESANRGLYQELQQEKQTVQEWIKICEKQSEDITHYRSLWENVKLKLEETQIEISMLKQSSSNGNNNTAQNNMRYSRGQNHRSRGNRPTRRGFGNYKIVSVLYP